ncbi:hypothetical protein L1S32_10565 [Methanogenium sp. S4BF]|uniref:hypothetical protein n=1 Tax=Methanogenium sp. S4BF TaxID=1789226 RepID=UPI002416F813|nr:hypothetical protein [Methanogenium sp. S4BF]WFN34274.1 hypothetical protein L1S32_10565 [Methanogenium sp. S4BF]
MSLPLSDRQFEFWKLRRDGLANIHIAQQFRISRQAVSKALLSMEDKVETTLLEMARANRIEAERYNAEKGVLFGRSVPFNAGAIVFISAKHGVQVWYEHEGECGSCPRYRECVELLWDFADELHLSLSKTDDPTRLADELFTKLREMV